MLVSDFSFGLGAGRVGMRGISKTWSRRIEGIIVMAQIERIDQKRQVAEDDPDVLLKPSIVGSSVV